MEHFDESNNIDNLTKKWWSKERQDLIENIEKAIQTTAANQDVLEMMIDLIKKTRVKVSMAEYFEEERGELIIE